MRPTYSSTSLASLPDAGTAVGVPISLGISIHSRVPALPPQCSGGVCWGLRRDEPASFPCERLQRIGAGWPETSVKNASRQCENWYPDRRGLSLARTREG